MGFERLLSGVEFGKLKDRKRCKLDIHLRCRSESQRSLKVALNFIS